MTGVRGTNCPERQQSPKLACGGKQEGEGGHRSGGIKSRTKIFQQLYTDEEGYINTYNITRKCI